MPYQISFTHPVAIKDREQYINECCVGGDAVVEALLPAVRDRYQDLQTNQEDWGWFIWFNSGDIRLAVDVHADDGDAGEFRVMLTSSRKRLFRFEAVDTPELEDLRALIEGELRKWQAANIAVSKSD